MAQARRESGVLQVGRPLVRIAAALLCCLAAAASPEPAESRRVLCVKDGLRANLRERGGLKAAVLRRLEGGTIVEVVDDAGRWLKVRTRVGGVVGWMHRSVLVGCREERLVQSGLEAGRHENGPGPRLFFGPIDIEAVRPAVDAMAPIFYLLCTTVMLSMVAGALGFTFGQSARVVIPLVLMSFLMTPRDMVELIFVMYSWSAVIAVTAVNAAFMGRRSRLDSPVFSRTLGLGGPALALMFVAFGRVPEVYLIALLFSWIAIVMNIRDVLDWVGVISPGLASWGPVITIVFLLVVFAEFYMAEAWKPWPFAQAGIGVGFFAIGARANW